MSVGEVEVVAVTEDDIVNSNGRFSDVGAHNHFTHTWRGTLEYCLRRDGCGLLELSVLLGPFELVA